MLEHEQRSGRASVIDDTILNNMLVQDPCQTTSDIRKSLM